jgi:hypothetical protein
MLPKRLGAPDTERSAQCEATVWIRPGASGRSSAQHSTIVKGSLRDFPATEEFNNPWRPVPVGIGSTALLVLFYDS